VLDQQEPICFSLRIASSSSFSSADSGEAGRRRGRAARFRAHGAAISSRRCRPIGQTAASSPLSPSGRCARANAGDLDRVAFRVPRATDPEQRTDAVTEARISLLCWATMRVFQGRHAREQANVLEGAGDARLLPDAEAVELSSGRCRAAFSVSADARL